VRYTNEFWDSYGIAIHDGQQEQGDLIFFSRTGSFPSHIGIMRDEESYFHAPGFNDTTVEIKGLEYEPITASGLERLLYTRNPIGFKSLSRVIEQPSRRYHQKPI